LLTAWRVITNAGSAEEVEEYACREGRLLAAELSPRQTLLETDCASVAQHYSKTSHFLRL
ncbi:hypothetical protein BAE44_0002205, partial [Dichanthelium oligosanthes]